MLEKTVERGFTKWAKAHGWKVKKGMSTGNKGTFDRIYMKNGVTAWIEWKHPDGDGELSHHQEVEWKDLIAHGANAMVFDNQEDAKEWLSGL